MKINLCFHGRKIMSYWFASNYSRIRGKNKLAANSLMKFLFGYLKKMASNSLIMVYLCVNNIKLYYE